MALDSSDDEGEEGNFVLVCGFGRVGQAVCELLTARLVRYKAFDMDPYRVAEARGRGLPVFYGDARRPDVLQARPSPTQPSPTQPKHTVVDTAPLSACLTPAHCSLGAGLHAWCREPHPSSCGHA